MRFRGLFSEPSPEPGSFGSEPLLLSFRCSLIHSTNICGGCAVCLHCAGPQKQVRYTVIMPISQKGKLRLREAPSLVQEGGRKGLSRLSLPSVLPSTRPGGGRGCALPGAPTAGWVVPPVWILLVLGGLPSPSPGGSNKSRAPRWGEAQPERSRVLSAPSSPLRGRPWQQEQIPGRARQP